MGAVEAEAASRTRWQHQNRCFVKEEARNERKCPCCSSLLSGSHLAPNNQAKVLNNIASQCLPFNSDSDMLMDRKWWLKKPNLGGHHTDFLNEHKNSFEVELETLSSEFVNEKIAGCEDQQTEVSNACIGKKNEASFSEFSATYATNDQNSRMREHHPLIDNIGPKNSAENDLGSFLYLDDDLMSWDSLNSLLSFQPKKLVECKWVGTPSWRSASKDDDLAFFVAQKSLEHIENYDLPKPQTKHYTKRPPSSLESFDQNKFSASLSDQMNEMGFYDLDVFTWESPISGLSPNDSDQSNWCNNEQHSATSIDEADVKNSPDIAQTRAELLKALNNSQTRAREAEKAAMQAYTEKEHLVTLFLRQASQLFAYKQWLHLLQLENLCLRLKYKNQPISCIFPIALPWPPYKGGQRNKGHCQAGNKNHCRPRHGISKGAVAAFALGLGLASAGMLLGWTMGWLFHAV